jgi:hypothetical protein
VARVVFGSCMIRYPMGGMLAHVLHYLLGLRDLGHDVVFVESGHYPNACYDLARNVMADDPRYGIEMVVPLLARFGIERWCYVDYAGQHYGLSATEVDQVFASADLFLDMGTHGSWMSVADRHDVTSVWIDGEPGFNQMKMTLRAAAGETLPTYDHYYTNGLNLGSAVCSAPTLGRRWGHLVHPVAPDLFPVTERPEGAPFTTVMNWQSHDRLEFDGRVYAQKDVEFEKFLDLPRRTGVPMEIAVAGRHAPRARLAAAGWRVRHGHEVSGDFDAFVRYVASSSGEFGVCKNIFVATWSGWFSGRSAAYLAAGRPVVVQDTGWSAHLPCGEGLFAVRDVGEAADALERIALDYDRHSKAARRLAVEVFDARMVVGRLLEEIGL